MLNGKSERRPSFNIEHSTLNIQHCFFRIAAWSVRYDPPPMDESMVIRATTVLCVRRDGAVAMAGDGQVTVGTTVMKHGAAKVRRLYHDKILAGFAGSAADAFALFSRFEAKLEEYRGNMERSVVELAKDWRMDKYLRQLQAFLIVANAERAYLISGTGDLIQPDDGILAIGSGGPYALAAARALMKHTQLNAADIAEEALRIAATICIYTNDQITVESL
jgi:ATP-dependent HslUV protease, peptidase subunit HslV